MPCGKPHRVLKPSGVLIDVRPVTAPIVLEVVIATHALRPIDRQPLVGNPEAITWT